MTVLWPRRSVLVFFLLGFGVPWLGWTIRGLTGLEGPAGMALHYTGDFMTVAGFVAVAVAAGSGGLESLLRRCRQIRAPIGWALFAVFLPLTWFAIPSLVYGATHGGIGRVDLQGVGQYVAPAAILAFTTGPLGEEVGWRALVGRERLSRKLTDALPTLSDEAVEAAPGDDFPLLPNVLASSCEGGAHGG